MVAGVPWHQCYRRHCAEYHDGLARARYLSYRVLEYSYFRCTLQATELVSAIVGESEKNVRALFAAARRCAPCIVCIDGKYSALPCNPSALPYK